jgi:sialidase-1
MSVVLMPFADPDKFGDYDAGKEPVEVAVHRQVANHYDAAFINLSQEIYNRIKAGEFSWKYDFKDLHPSPYGQELYYQSIRELLEKAEGTTPKPAQWPEPLDAFSYSKARYVELEEAVPIKGFKIDPVWEPYPPLATRPGFVKVPMLVGETIGDAFELTFTGRAVGIAIMSGPDAGTLSYRIDGKKARSLDLFTKWSTQLHLPWYLMLADDLKPGKHTLKVTLTDTKNPASDGYACRIVYFLVNE